MLTRGELSAGFYRTEKGKVCVCKAGGITAVTLLQSVDTIEFMSRQIAFEEPPMGGFHTSNGWVWGSDEKYKLIAWRQMSNGAKRFPGVLPRGRFKSARIVEQEADQMIQYSGIYAEAVYSALCL